LDRTYHRVTVTGEAIDLTPTEFELLAVLIATPGRVYSRTHLLEALHDFALEGVERTIDVHVRNLRAKIEPDPRHPRYIETVFGVGYRFAAA
ncbi:MAG TPA: winged helix-turn-helix domain-containing protein, partial [Rhodothermales bacterium]|nr:winged helix-turn-helix domain-containing protein [Rhodothermales bacterium]